MWQRKGIVMLNEVKHLTVIHCDSMEMFRFAQHDSALTVHLAAPSFQPNLEQLWPQLAGDEQAISLGVIGNAVQLSHRLSTILGT